MLIGQRFAFVANEVQLGQLAITNNARYQSATILLRVSQ